MAPAPKRPVFDGRQNTSLQVAPTDLAVLSERGDRKRMPALRSAYLMLIEAASSPVPWTAREQAERAGVSPGLLKEVLESLEDLGFVRRVEGGGFQLVPLGARPETLPLAESLPPVLDRAARPEDPAEAALRVRVEKFYAVHADRVTPIRGSRPAHDSAALDAARTILRREHDSHAILSRLDFALGHRFYADKVLTLRDFNRWYPKISAAFLAQDRERPERPAPPSEVRYDTPDGRMAVVQ